ncbi:tetratricopeptide repeat protein [Chryseobacterium gossypii]|uniref:tetratricopeptide repeat protein n=1 Tax=Chryseobacterium gossypii TaxID=3231602 RepID=UPI003524930A
MNILITIPLLLSGACLYGQNSNDYTMIYTKTFLETSQKDFNKALKIADSLYATSETPYFRAKSLMLSATLYQQAGDFKKSIEYALQSEKIIKDTDNTIWKARVYGFLATQYRFLNLYNKSKEYTDMAYDMAKDITDPDIADNTKGLIMQEMAYYDIEHRNYVEAIDKLNEAKSYIRHTNPFFEAHNEQLLGLNYYHLRKPEEALVHYQNAIELSEKLPENYLTGLIHNGLANVYMQKNELKKAKEHLEIAQRISDHSNYLALKNEVYGTSKKYYMMMKNIKQYSEAKEKQDSVGQIISERAGSYINESYTELEKQNAVIRKRNSIKDILIAVAGVFAAGGVTYFIIYRKRQKKNIDKFRKILEEREQNPDVITESGSIPGRSEDSGADDIPMMLPETEEKILAKLEEFEKADLYTSNNMSLSYLAIYCETNTKYLSHIINKYKNKDFNNYVNELRIDFIIAKLRTEPRYRNYKIATLAEEAGFSSPNKFSTVFKKTTSMSPSLFIKYMEQNTSIT